MHKNCLNCKNEFWKGKYESVAYWLTKRFCSRSCANFGSKKSVETRRKQSLAIQKFYDTNPKVKERLSEIRKNRTGFLNGAFNKHWKQSEITVSKRRGYKNSAWKGGITPINTAIRNSEPYQEWRKEVFKRDDFTCQDCGKRGVELHADHIKPFAYFPALRLDLQNGKTLCKPCHQLTPTYGGRAKIFLTA